MGFDAGRVHVRLEMANDVVAVATVACVRPDVAGLWRGQQADLVVTQLPFVYALCGRAQGVAARLALAAARGETVAARVDAGVAAEALREHAWKLLVDWPRLFGLAADEALFIRVAKTAPGAGAALAGAVRVKPLFAMAVGPVLQEQIARRGAELLALLTGGTTSAGAVAATTQGATQGTARVMTARGELRHTIALAGERIADYVIEAPTDRLFGPDSPLPAMLHGLHRREIEVTVAGLVAALDPCVPWALEMVDQP